MNKNEIFFATHIVKLEVSPRDLTAIMWLRRQLGGSSLDVTARQFFNRLINSYYDSSSFPERS